MRNANGVIGCALLCSQFSVVQGEGEIQCWHFCIRPGVIQMTVRTLRYPRMTAAEQSDTTSLVGAGPCSI